MADLEPVALVTGACSGIGLEMARILGARGHDLVLVSHRAGPLAEAAARIEAESRVKALPIAMDLARPEAADDLRLEIATRDLAVEILVNNAGMFFFGEVGDADYRQANTMLQLHVVTPSLLATAFVPGMRDRRRGHVLFVSSISAWRDFPGIAYYGSTKKYLRGFARALRSEVAPYGINVTCLCPGATATGLYDPSVVPVDLAKRLGVMMDAETVARAGIEGMFRGEAEVVPGILSRAMAEAAARTPQPVIDWIRRRAPWLPVADP